MRASKGEQGYISNQKKVRLIKTIVLLAVVIAIFWFGIALTGDRRNYFTIVAVLVCIPFAMSASGTIVMWLRHPADRETVAKITKNAGNARLLYELFVTTREDSLLLDVAAVSDRRLLAYAGEKNAAKVKAGIVKYLSIETEVLAPGLKIEILTDPDQFARRLASFKAAETEEELEITEELAGLLLALSM